MTMSEEPFRHQHLLNIDQLSVSDIQLLLKRAEEFYLFGNKEEKKLSTLRGRTVLNVFMENSTRTRLSFEIASKRMGADAVNMSGSGSSTSKGESLIDTAKNLNAMNPSIVVLRHRASGASLTLSKIIEGSVVNAGDGMHAHPTQALLDLSTIAKHKGKQKVDGVDCEGLEIAIVGDIEHSRVARSNVVCLTKMGANVRLCAPHTLSPRDVEKLADNHKGTCVVHHDFSKALDGTDVVMMLRVQNERLGGASRFANTREFSRYFGLNSKTLQYTKKDAIIMHPGPINQGVEMMPDVAELDRALVLEQVERGVALRMAVLHSVYEAQQVDGRFL